MYIHILFSCIHVCVSLGQINFFNLKNFSILKVTKFEKCVEEKYFFGRYKRRMLNSVPKMTFKLVIAVLENWHLLIFFWNEKKKTAPAVRVKVSVEVCQITRVAVTRANVSNLLQNFFFQIYLQKHFFFHITIRDDRIETNFPKNSRG